MPRSAPQTRSVRTAAAIAGIALMGPALVACSGSSKDGPRPAATPTAETATFTVQSRLGKVAGQLPKPARDTLVDDVAGVAEAWMKAAYLGGDAPDLEVAFADFTADAAQLATKQSAITSNAGFAEAGDVNGGRGRVAVDVLAPRGKVAGATARVRVVLDIEGDAATEVQIDGSLFLTKTKGSWEVFGFDLNRGQKAGEGE